MGPFGFDLGLMGQSPVVSGGGGGAWTATTDWTRTNGNLTAERTAASGGFHNLFATAAKTNGTFVVTVDAIGPGAFSAFPVIGLDLDGTSTSILGGDSGKTIGYLPSGEIYFVSGIQGTFATWTTGDVIKVVKAGANVSFYKNNVLQTTIDVSSGTYGASSPPSGNAYPAISNGNVSGAKFTADFSGW